MKTIKNPQIIKTLYIKNYQQLSRTTWTIKSYKKNIKYHHELAKSITNHQESSRIIKNYPKHSGKFNHYKEPLINIGSHREEEKIRRTNIKKHKKKL